MQALSQDDQPKGLSLVHSIQAQHIATQLPLATAIFEKAHGDVTSSGSAYVPQSKLQEHLKKAQADAVAYFDEQADFGPADRNAAAAKELKGTLAALAESAILKNRHLLEATLKDCVVNFTTTVQTETMDDSNQPRFVPRARLEEFTQSALVNALAAFSQEESDWFVEPEGPNADLLKHTNIELRDLRRSCLDANTALLSKQVPCLYLEPRSQCLLSH